MSTELSWRYGSAEVDARQVRLDDLQRSLKGLVGRGPARGAPAAFEMGLSRMKMPTGEGVGLLSGSYLVPAMSEDWGIGPSAYGAATGHSMAACSRQASRLRPLACRRSRRGLGRPYAGAGGGSVLAK